MAKNKARKWSNLVGKLPEDAPRESSEWMEKVFVLKDELKSATMDDLACAYADLDEEEALAELAQKERNIKYKALELRILEELDKVKAIAGTDMWRGRGQTFSPKFTPRPVIENPAALAQWIQDTGQQHLLTLPPARLKSIVCEALDPDGAAVLNAAQRAALKPGDPASGACPPGVSAFMAFGLNHTTTRKKSPALPSSSQPEQAFGDDDE
jgi:hypothetical protein